MPIDGARLVAGDDPDLPASVRRVAAILAEAGHAAPIRLLPNSARTAREAAGAIGCDVAQIAKSIVFKAASGRAVLVVASGVNRIDEAKVAAHLGAGIGKADADFVREATGFAIGGVSPVGHATAPIVLIDRDLARVGDIWAAAGHSHAVFPLDFDTLVRLTAGEVVAVA